MNIGPCRYYILPDSLNLDTLLVDLDQPKTRPKRPERPAGGAEGPFLSRAYFGWFWELLGWRNRCLFIEEPGAA